MRQDTSVSIDVKFIPSAFYLRRNCTKISNAPASRALRRLDSKLSKMLCLFIG